MAAARLERVRRLLTNPGVAVAADRADLDAAVDEATRTGDWVIDEWGTLDPADAEAGREFAMAVGQATVDRAGRTTFDMAWSIPRSQFEDTLVFRVLGADTRLTDGAFALTQSEVVDHADAVVTLDTSTATIRIDGVPRGAGDVHVRLMGQYVVPERSRLASTEDPIGYGLLARTGDVTALGHWLPVPTYEDGAYADTGGDIGAFRPATWSVVVIHPGLIVSGGNEGSCVSPQAALDRPDIADETECTWLRGRNLRDLSAVVIGSGDQDNPFTYLDRQGESLGLIELHGDDRAAVVDEAAATWNLLHDLFGPLAWGEVDIVAVPLRPAAAGMEFPGMIWIDPEVVGTDGGFDSYVLMHEMAHQWFHGLLGNGSLADPVVDESLAQYGSYVAMASIYGQAAADKLDASSIRGRWERAGSPADVPAQQVAAFPSERVYGAAVYGRAGAAWVDADRAFGRDRVTDAIRAVMEEFRLREVTAATFLDALTAADPEVGAAISQGWDRER